MVRQRPHRMHGADLGPAILRTQARAGRAAEFRQQRIEHPGVVAVQGLGREDVDVHFLEQVQGREDVDAEREG